MLQLNENKPVLLKKRIQVILITLVSANKLLFKSNQFTAMRVKLLNKSLKILDMI